LPQTLDLQAYENNQAKYWLYRERLKKYFMTYVGLGPTASLPASERLYGDPAYNGRTFKWGDATINLAEYISVLAMEIQMLGRVGYSYEDMRGSFEELYFAMSAFNRLDLIAETHYGPPIQLLNGFFVRDDINTQYPDPNSNIMIRLNERITDPNRTVSKFDSGSNVVVLGDGKLSDEFILEQYMNAIIQKFELQWQF